MVKARSLGGTSIPRKFSYEHRDQKNPHGVHNEWVFMPEHNYNLRCPACNRLADPATMCIPGKCPSCNETFSKSELRDISVEAQIVNQNYTGWSRKILDRLGDSSKGDEPTHIDKDLEPTGRDSDFEVAKNMTAWANRAARDIKDPSRELARRMSRGRAQAIRQRKARDAMIDHLRTQSRVSEILSENPYA